MATQIIIDKAIPFVIVIALWLNGWFYPLLLVPILYVMVFEKRGPYFIGFELSKIRRSAALGLIAGNLLSLVYLALFIFYRVAFQPIGEIDWSILFTSMVWYSLYDEIVYRGFFLSHFSDVNESVLSARGLFVNILQTLLFISAPIKVLTIGEPLVLLLFSLLGFVNGLIFMKTRNLAGCILSHSIVIGSAWLFPRIFG